MTTDPDLESEVLRLIREDLLRDRAVAPLDPETPLIAGRLLDSLRLLRLVSLLEARYGVRIPDEQVLPEHFATVRAIAALLASLRPRGAT